MFFKSRDLTLIGIFSALWTALDVFVAPVFYAATHTPFLCDFLAAVILILTVWVVRKFGVATLTGVITAILHFALRGFTLESLFFLGFIGTSILFDFSTWVMGYDRCFNRGYSSMFLIVFIFTVATGIAGGIIGYIMVVTLGLPLGFIPVWAGFHALGGGTSSVFGFGLSKGLERRGIKPLR
jgi:hypothetical protein